MRNTIGFILALVLFDGVAVAWAVREFWSVRPPSKPKPKSTPHERLASEEDPGHLER
jgi:hypothetical protein